VTERAGPQSEVDPSLYDVKAFDERIARVARDYQAVARDLKKAQAALPAFPDPPPLPPKDAGPKDPARLAWDTWRNDLTRLAGDFAELLSNLSVVQARARLESIALVRVELQPEQGIKIARQNRPDWMNARAALVDQWRQIEIAANALRSELNVRLNGDLGTVGDNPFRFRDTNGRLSVGLEFDAPLTRVVERNAYRESLINYQRARRAYYQFEDRVAQNVRSVLRSTRLSQLNFEIRRAAVRVAIDQVEVARLNLQRPPRVGEKGSESGSNVGRDLVDALQRLLDAQNAFLRAWVDYEAQRLSLDFELGTMRLDENGMWIDPGPIDADFAQGPDETPPLPPELPGVPEPTPTPQAKPTP
jgi:outer membrane protein TolC